LELSRAEPVQRRGQFLFDLARLHVTAGELALARQDAPGVLYRAAEALAVAVRYNLDGNLDTSFGSSGLVRTDFGGSESADALALQPDGKLARLPQLGPRKPVTY
jgi:hypothetical protein